MNLYRSTIFACVISVMLTGCSEWKQVGQTKLQHDMINTAMLFDGKNGIEVGEFNLTRYTVDSGKRWLSTMGSKTHMYGLYGCSMLNEKTVFATGNNKQAFYSTNCGETWHPMGDIKGIGKCISFSSVSDGWVASRTWFAATNDQGKTWTEMTLPQGATMVEALCKTGPGIGYAVSERKDVFFTADSGLNWEQLSNPFVELKRPFKPFLCRQTQGIAIAMDGKTGIIACIGTIEKENVIILSRTDDGGKSWRKPEVHKLKLEPKTVNASSKGYVTVLNKDMSITVFSR